ncbi:MAG: response regulator transcription factor [Pseudomonadota bacterium]
MIKKRILVADDHALFRVGLKALLSDHPYAEVVGEVDNGLALFEALKIQQPDVLILDYEMPNLNGLDALQEIRQRQLPVQVIVLTGASSELVLREFLAVGVQGMLYKDDDPQELLLAVNAVLAGEQSFSATVQAKLEKAQQLDSLTSRERQVIRLIAQGLTNKAIAESTGIAIKTVDNHRTNMMKKLNLHSVAEVVAFANRMGLG